MPETLFTCTSIRQFSTLLLFRFCGLSRWNTERLSVLQEQRWWIARMIFRNIKVSSWMFTQPARGTGKKWHSRLFCCVFQPRLNFIRLNSVLIKTSENEVKIRTIAGKLRLLVSHKTNLEWNVLLCRTAGRSLILTGARQSQSKSMIMYANDLAGESSGGLCTHGEYFPKHPWHGAFIYVPLYLATFVDQISWTQILQFDWQHFCEIRPQHHPHEWVLELFIWQKRQLKL